MSLNAKPPCYKCTDRTVNCHAECEEYNVWKKKRQEEQLQLRQQIDTLNYRYFKTNTSITALKSERVYR